MPSEKRPKTTKIARNGKVWNINQDEIRAREGVIGDDGIRRVHYAIDPGYPGDTAAAIQRMKARGYEHKEVNNGLDIEFSMPDSKFKAMEKVQHDQALARHRTQKDSTMGHEGTVAGLEQLQSMTPESFAVLD